jgi:hypothetical protein
LVSRRISWRRRGASRQVFDCGQSGEDNGLVGEIAIRILGFDQLSLAIFQQRFIALNLAFQFQLAVTKGDGGCREIDQSIDQDLDLGFRSGDGKLQFGYLFLSPGPLNSVAF